VWSKINSSIQGREEGEEEEEEEEEEKEGWRRSSSVEKERRRETRPTIPIGVPLISITLRWGRPPPSTT